MTLIILTVRQQDVMFVSDRRLSWNGTIREDAACKTGSLQAQEACSIFAYTGLVSHNHFEIRDFMRGAFSKLKLTSTLPECIEGLASALTLKFKNNMWIKKEEPDKRRLTVAFAGYDMLAVPFVAVVSNHEGVFDDPGPVEDHFRFEIHPFALGTSTASATYVFGNRKAMPQKHLHEINELLKGEAPRQALKLKAAEVIRLAADDPDSANSIGKSLMAASLPRFIPPWRPQPASHFMPDAATDDIALFDQYLVHPTGYFAMVGGSLSTPGSTLSGPHSSGESLCWCGSGRKAKHCHARGNRRQ